MEEGSTAYVFQSTPSARRATVFVAQLARGRGNFNPRPPRGGRHEKPVVDEKPVVISIHALREEGDLQGGRLDPGTDHFNPRPPRGGRRRAASANSRTYGNFNPRPPRGGRPLPPGVLAPPFAFQSTPSARRATACQHHWHCAKGYFNPRPPRGGRRPQAAPHAAGRLISIHALREEGDRRPRAGATDGVYFNPRPPRGGRRTRPPRSVWPQSFQSTPSARRATVRCKNLILGQQISIHALREEGDSKSGEKIHHVCSIIHTCAQFEKELYEGSGEMQNKSC